MANITLEDFSSNLSSGDVPSGEIRRLYNFGEQVASLAPNQTKFFTFVSNVGKEATDDPEFKVLERRHQWQRRYVFVSGGGDLSTNHFTYTTWSGLSAGSEIDLHFKSDYKNTGEFSPEGQTSYYGGADTIPNYLLAGQVLSIPISLEDNSDSSYVVGKDFMKVQIKSFTANPSTYEKGATCEIISMPSTFKSYDAPGTAVTPASSDKIYIGHPLAGDFDKAVGSMSDDISALPTTSTVRDGRRVYIAGSAFATGSGYPDTWQDQLSSNYGYTQIWKTVCKMDNTTRATMLRGPSNEWARVWKEKFMEHKMDINRGLLHSSLYRTTNDAGDTIRYTQGAIDYVTSSGYVFDLQEDAHTQDDFLDDLSDFFHPMNGNTGSVLCLASTQMFNWMNKIGNNGFVSNTTNATQASFSAAGNSFQVNGRDQVFKVDITKIGTPYGTLNLTRDVNLDGTGVHLLCINLSNVKYRPLVGNGQNRDTSIYVGVKTLENSGEDIRIDLIQTEAGLHWSIPESHAVWLGA